MTESKDRRLNAAICTVLVILAIAGGSIYQLSLPPKSPTIKLFGEPGGEQNWTQPQVGEDKNYSAYYTGTIEHSSGSRAIGIIGWNSDAYDFPIKKNATNATIVTDSTNGKDVDLFILDANNTVIVSSTGTKDEQPEVITLNETILSSYNKLTAAVQYYCAGPEDRVTVAYYYLSIDVYY